jgi:photosystem II stability/assembly factor-like uncharacterized protein
MMRLLRTIAILVILLCGRTLSAQWEVVAPGLAGPPISYYGVFGCMEYREGIVWAGSICIWKSLDTGKTWTRSSDTLGEVRSLKFFNKDIGAACIGAGGLYVTTNQGARWRKILDIGYSNAVVFGETANDIMITLHDAGGVMITRDQGRNWRVHQFNNAGFTSHAIRDKKGRIAVVVGGSQFIADKAAIFITTDFGDTWVETPGGFDLDTWSIAADSCNADVFYGANEEVLSFTNGISEVYMTTNVGTSWNAVFGEPGLLSGAIITGPNTIYATSQKRGVMRSTDRGMTWKNIGGPGATFDSRPITLVNDNIVLVLDTMGSIWRTMNSGGDPISLPSPGSVTLTMDRPFDDESPFVCDLPIGRSIKVSPACNARILNVSIGGEDADAFRVLDFPTEPQPGDSIWLSFNTETAGDYNAEVVIELENGERITVPLHAIAKEPAIVRLAEIETIRNDTIGGTIVIPIQSTGSSSIPAGSLSIRYDTTVLVYQGSFSSSGAQLDVASGPGHARVNFNRGDSVLAYATFEYYPLRDSCTTVRIDSIEFENSDDLCVTLAEEALTAYVCTSISCGTMLLSTYTRYGILPTLRLSPNPTSSILAVHADKSVGDVRYEIFDQTGTLRLTGAGSLTSSNDLEITVGDLTEGAYYLRLSTDNAVRTLRFVKQ